MKRYKKYMDEIKASDTLHQRLRELKERKRKPAAWAKYGSIAAALVLVFGGVSVGMHRSARLSGYIDSLFHEPAYCPEQEAENQPDIAIVDPSEVDEPLEKALGSYDVASGSGPEAVVAHYILPYIDYGGTRGGEAAGQIAADWDIPKEAARRDLARDEITALLGGEDAVNTHLDWSKYELTGWGAWYEDGSFWGAYIMGYAGPMDHFEFAVTADQLPPTCIAFPGSVTQEIRGLTVTADGHDGKDGCSRRVSFMKDGYGYRFDLSSADTEQAELLVSRLVCRIADRGLALWTVDPSVETYTCPDCGQTIPVGDRHYHTQPKPVESPIPDYDPAYEDGVAMTHPYDPDGADPSKDSPRGRGENWCGTPDPNPDDAMCSGYPVPGETYTCPICEKVLPVGMEHSHELCGLPLAPQ